MKPALTLYTSNPADAGFRSLAALLSQQQPVTLRHLAELPPPDRRRRQQLRAELGVLREQLDSVRYLLGVGQSQPRRYAQEIELLQADCTRIEGLMAGLEQQLAELPPLPEQQEGGQAA
ncbi:hypothetical protein [Hymenobacter yonginensis]|uniref:Uncharacterized protein n=1 Tax=Hymenobacter yonginensis TaxID=748197 RepID=A0ABY7PUN5_9BACT|nr:hypothetical protein [Hymenobacter yonginensis]WBO86269.1 hypothetical protein O9Z63_08400 [Hymenobacter yonginensis]